jgi:hypothetical protein
MRLSGLPLELSVNEFPQFHPSALPTGDPDCERGTSVAHDESKWPATEQALPVAVAIGIREDDWLRNARRKPSGELIPGWTCS